MPSNTTTLITDPSTLAQPSAQDPGSPRTRMLKPDSTAGRQFSALTTATGLPMFCIDSATGEPLAHPDSAAGPLPPFDLPAPLPAGRRFGVVELSSGVVRFAVSLPATGNQRPAAIGYVLSPAAGRNLELVMSAAAENWSQEEFDNWIAATPRISGNLLEPMLSLAVGTLEHGDVMLSLHAEVEDLTEQIQHTYEEISLLHSLTHNMQISRTPLELAETCVNRMESIISSTGTAVWIEERDEKSLLVKGKLPFNELGMERLIARFGSHDWSRPVVKNQIPGTLLGADFPGLENFVLVPIAEGSNRYGWMLSCNMYNGEEFGTVEANLLNSLATILGTHIRNIQLYEQHQDLLISFVRSLVSTLDAKDPYTRGHSERVALVARRIGEQMQLPAEDLHDIYLSGLLHDIGKIGVDDRILQKPGKLTDEEFKKIQEHPMIGYNILKELRNLQKVLPGVRSHHEAYNGKGYPDCLAGEEIPLMARILAVADSYDAMGSDRPYRQGMPTDKIEEIFRRGSGEQWDSRVIDSYFAARDDVQEICDSYTPSNGNLLPKSTPVNKR